MKILIAEDDPVSQRMLESALTKWGYQVVIANNGQEASEILDSKDFPKLIILDWIMPIMDGLQVCQKIRNSLELRSCYVIFLTVKERREDIVKGLEAGADDYVTKPFDLQELKARVQVGVRTLELLHMKDELISIVSHELRSPLTSIINSLGVLSSGMVGDLSQDARKMMDIAHRNSERLLRLINDILDIDKIEFGVMEFDMKPLDLKELLKQSIESNSSYAQQFGINLIMNDSVPVARVMGDEDRLMQVMTNLLSNAIKFSPKDETINISLEKNNGNIRVSIKDKGPGIPEEFRNKVFEKFTQTQIPGQNSREGTGLGLSIAKAIIEGMDGHIAFETETGVGTTFYFDLPKYKSAH
ncbi:response regulator [Candidatus Poribacteria bacterium]|nr:response regulator [Candidatus Poribacteria bacterium]